MGKKAKAIAAESAAASLKGVAKKQRKKNNKQEKKASESNGEDVGVVAKKKRQYFAVAVGREPGIYKERAEYRKQVSNFPDAKGKRCFTLAEAQRYMKAHSAGEKQVPERSMQALSQAAKATAATDKSGNAILFTTDRTGLARGFTLGMVRVGGKSVLSDAAKPVFAPWIGTSATASVLPQHEAMGEASSSETEDKEEQEESEDDSGDLLAPDKQDSGAEEEDDNESPEEEQIGKKDPHTKSTEKVKPGTVREYADDELPWYDANVRIQSQSARLHNEIVELTSLLQPSEEEDAQRHKAKKLLEDVVVEIFPGASLETFGSFATGLHLPTSDVDCVITGSTVEPSQAGNALTALGNALRGKEWVKDLEVIRARVPIVKLFVMPWGLKFDISCGVGGGIPAAGYIREQLQLWPPLKPLVTILKLFLLQRNMNEVYTGGLSSFALILSVVAFLKMHTSRLPWRKGGRAQQLDCNLGLLLIDYFRFFGRQLAVTKVGVAAGGDMHATGCYLKLKVFGNQQMDRRDRGDRLSIRDPLDNSNDVSRGAFNSAAVRYAFDHAYHMLTHQPSELPTSEMSYNELAAWRGTSRLAWILRLDEVLAIRPPPPRKGGSKRPRDVLPAHLVPGSLPSAAERRATAAAAAAVGPGAGAPRRLPPRAGAPPVPMPRPTTHHSSNHAPADRFFDKRPAGRGGYGGAEASGSRGHRGGDGHRGDIRGGPGYSRKGGGGGDGYRGYRNSDHSGNQRWRGESDGWRPVRR